MGRRDFSAIKREKKDDAFNCFKFVLAHYSVLSLHTGVDRDVLQI